MDALISDPAHPGDAGTAAKATIGAVVIGRNEGQRLVRCLDSLSGQVEHLVYVDSGSTDGSVANARAAGAEVVELDLRLPFTAARARNAGLAELRRHGAVRFVQFVDGDCELRPGWIDAARNFLEGSPEIAVVFGRLRERFPEASVYNRLCDSEWNGPVGETAACGGIALMRVSALDQSGVFNPDLIAGEEPELCVRLRAKGWRICRIEAEMAWHDAAMTRFGQWWKRARRAGHASAEGMALHGAAPERHGVAGTVRALAWGVGLPLGTIALAVFTSWAWLLLFLAYPAQVLRLALREGAGSREAWERAVFLTIAKFPEALGILSYLFGRLTNRRPTLIEYK